MATLAGVWKLSTSTSLRSAARRAAADASLPKRIRFVVETERANFEAGRCEVPFREQCGGSYELHDEGERRAAFSVKCPPRAGVAADCAPEVDKRRTIGPTSGTNDTAFKNPKGIGQICGLTPTASATARIRSGVDKSQSDSAIVLPSPFTKSSEAHIALHTLVTPIRLRLFSTLAKGKGIPAFTNLKRRSIFPF